MPRKQEQIHRIDTQYQSASSIVESRLERDIAALELGNSELERKLADTLQKLTQFLHPQDSLPDTIKGVPLEQALGVAGKLIQALSAERFFTRAELVALGFGVFATALGGILTVIGNENPDPQQLQDAVEQIKQWVPLLRSHLESLQDSNNPLQMLGFLGIGAGVGSGALGVGVFERFRLSAGKKARDIKYGK